MSTPLTSTPLRVIDATDPRNDLDDRFGRWAVACTLHGSLARYPDRTTAARASIVPLETCPDCRDCALAAARRLEAAA